MTFTFLGFYPIPRKQDFIYDCYLFIYTTTVGQSLFMIEHRAIYLFIVTR